MLEKPLIHHYKKMTNNKQSKQAIEIEKILLQDRWYVFTNNN